MRLSADDADSAHCPNAVAEDVEIYFNGVRTYNCVIADDEAGEIGHCDPHLHGFIPATTRRDQGMSDLHIYFGRVEIRKILNT